LLPSDICDHKGRTNYSEKWLRQVKTKKPIRNF
jgi:hypothetical protein